MSPRPVISLNQQIAEVKYELRYRRATYPHLAGKSGRSASELNNHLVCLEAALCTLKTVQKTEQALRAAIDGDI